MTAQLMLIGGAVPIGDRRRQARRDMRLVAERIARAFLDGDGTVPMILEDAATLAAIVIAYTGGDDV